MKKVIFIDFDGTITKVDTCNAMVEAFAKSGCEDINRQWEAKEISTFECANKIFSLFEANLEDVKRLLDTIKIDQYFKEFLNQCREKGYLVYVLSDGYDLNIETIFINNNIRLTYYSNKLIYDDEKGFSIQSPFSNSRCKKCGTCKTKLINELRGDNDQIIYIGDGYSDMCPVTQADLVFAKDKLYRYCLGKGIPAILFENFNQIKI